MASVRRCIGDIRFLGWMVCFFVGMPMVFGQYSVPVARPDTVPDFHARRQAGHFSYYPALNRPLACQSPKWVRISLVPSLLATAGMATWPLREEVREARNTYVPDFAYSYDDFLQYSPMATYYAMNVAGLKGQHAMARATVNLAYSNLISSVLVYSLKTITHVQRPDGSAFNSFPSGHTATAFTGATFMHKEYGQYRHPLYSAFGFTMATGTGVGRQLNNRHWISDVLVGAGIGILSTELAYILADKIHGNWGKNKPLTSLSRYYDPANPSFMEFRVGVTAPLSLKVDNTMDISINKGFTSGLEGAYFFTPHWGVGGQITFSSYPFDYVPNELDVELAQLSSGYLEQYFGSKNFSIGPYFETPVFPRWFFSCKVHPVYIKGVTGSTSITVKQKYQAFFGEKLMVQEYKPKGNFGLTAGVSMRYAVSRAVSVRMFCDYSGFTASFSQKQIDNINMQTGTYDFKNSLEFENLRSRVVTYGGALAVFVW